MGLGRLGVLGLLFCDAPIQFVEDGLLDASRGRTAMPNLIHGCGPNP